MMYLYIAIALLVGLLLGKALFGKKAAPAPAPAPVAAVPAAPQEDEDEIAAVIAAIAAMMGCAPEQVDAFLAEYVRPVLDENRDFLGADVQVNV